VVGLSQAWVRPQGRSAPSCASGRQARWLRLHRISVEGINTRNRLQEPCRGTVEEDDVDRQGAAGPARATGNLH